MILTFFMLFVSICGPDHGDSISIKTPLQTKAAVGSTYVSPIPPPTPRPISEGGFLVDDWISAWQTFKPGNIDRLKLQMRKGNIPKDLKGSLFKNGPGKFHQR